MDAVGDLVVRWSQRERCWHAYIVGESLRAAGPTRDAAEWAVLHQYHALLKSRKSGD